MWFCRVREGWKLTQGDLEREVGMARQLEDWLELSKHSLRARPVCNASPANAPGSSVRYGPWSSFPLSRKLT